MAQAESYVANRNSLIEDLVDGKSQVQNRWDILPLSRYDTIMKSLFRCLKRFFKRKMVETMPELSAYQDEKVFSMIPFSRQVEENIRLFIIQKVGEMQVNFSNDEIEGI